MPRVIRDDGARLEYEVREAAQERRGTFVFQHGMGGNREQPLGYLGPVPAHRVVAMDARGHGDSSDVVGSSRVGFDAFADDVLALLDDLGESSVVLGGISMGAAVALNTAVRHPERVQALVLCRPAWLETAQDQSNTEAYGLIADLLDTHEQDEVLDLLVRHPRYAAFFATSPAAAGSLRHQVTRPRAAVNAEILRRLPVQSPAPDLADWQGIDVPVLVIGHQDDPLHPWSIAAETAERIPGARLIRVPSKDVDREAFQREIDAAIGAFLAEVGVP